MKNRRKMKNINITKLKVKDLQRHYYTEDDRFYTTKEVKKLYEDYKWIPYEEYIRVLTQLVKLKNKLRKERIGE